MKLGFKKLGKMLAMLAKNCPNLAFFTKNDQKLRFFAFFLRTAHQIFLIFCSKHSLWSRKKNGVFAFLGKFQNGPFWPKLTQIWPKFGHIWLYQAWSTGVQKNFRQKFLIFFFQFFFSKSKITVSGEKIHILPWWTPLWLPVPHT